MFIITSVHSFPCQEAYLGNFKLLQPPDENQPEFWVDFNSASQSITMYVAESVEDDEVNDEIIFPFIISIRNARFITEYIIVHL